MRGIAPTLMAFAHCSTVLCTIKVKFNKMNDATHSCHRHVHTCKRTRTHTNFFNKHSHPHQRARMYGHLCHTPPPSPLSPSRFGSVAWSDSFKSRGCTLCMRTFRNAAERKSHELSCPAAGKKSKGFLDWAKHKHHQGSKRLERTAANGQREWFIGVFHNGEVRKVTTNQPTPLANSAIAILMCALI